ncbi:MAG: hypothetical protein V2A58_09000 [Planctomycetota bacterium]
MKNVLKTVAVLACAWTVSAMGLLLAEEPKEAQGEVMDLNGGFEKTETFTKYEEQYRKWVKDGIELPETFVKPAGWQPSTFFEHKWKLETVSDEKQAHSGTNCLRLFSGMIYYYDYKWAQMRVAPGDQVVVSVWARGPKDVEDLFLVQLNCYGENAEGKVVPLYDVGNPQVIVKRTTPEWTQHTGTYMVTADTSKAVPGVRVQRVSVSLISREGTEIWFDDVEVKILRAEKKAE